MRAFLITLCLAGMFFLSFADSAYSACRTSTSIVFGNGMFNDLNSSLHSMKKLTEAVALAQTQAMPAIDSIYLAYARDRSSTPNGSVLEEGLEVARQNYGDNSIKYYWIYYTSSISWRYMAYGALLGLLTEPPEWFRIWMHNKTRLVNQSVFINDPDFRSMMDGDPRVGFPGYRSLLFDGNRVLIVSHSQGNYYANAVYDALVAEDPDWAKSIGNVQVATPANSVHSSGPYTTLAEDILIAHIPEALPVTDMVSTMPTGSILPLRASRNYFDFGRLAWGSASYGHAFAGWYLKGSYSREIILDQIARTLNGSGNLAGLTYPACDPNVPLGKSARLIMHSPDFVGFDYYYKFYFGFDEHRHLAYRLMLPRLLPDTATATVQITAINVHTGESNNTNAVVSPIQSDWAVVGLPEKQLQVTPSGFVFGSSTKVDVSDNLSMSSSEVRSGFPFSQGIPSEAPGFSPSEVWKGTLPRIKATQVPYKYDAYYLSHQWSGTYAYNPPAMTPWGEESGSFKADYYIGLWKHDGLNETSVVSPITSDTIKYDVALDGSIIGRSQAFFGPYEPVNTLLCNWRKILSSPYPADGYPCTGMPSPVSTHLFSYYEGLASLYSAMGISPYPNHALAWVMEPSLNGRSWVVTPVRGALFFSAQLPSWQNELFRVSPEGSVEKLHASRLVQGQDDALNDDDVWRLLDRAPLAHPTAIRPSK